MRKYKVIHIITRLDKGGSSEEILLTCNKLGKTKYQPILIYGKSIPYQRLNTSYKYFYIPELVREISPFKDIIAFLRILLIIKKEKPDIVHTHSSKAGLIGRLATFFLKYFLPSLRSTKILHTPHGHVFYGYFNRLKTSFLILLERLAAKITDKLIALTEGEKIESIKFGVGKSEKWVVIPSGVEYNLISSTKKKLGGTIPTFDADFIVGTVARLEPVKGVHYFIQAIPHILKSINKKIIFIIVGDGSQRENLKSLIRKLKIENHVIFTGMVDNVMDYIEPMDVYVQPSLNEGMGKALVQAQLLKKPIVATNVQGIPYVVMNGESAILVPPKDPISIAHAIIKLLNDEQLRKIAGEHGYEFVNEEVEGFKRFSDDYMMYKLTKLYEEMLSH